MGCSQRDEQLYDGEIRGQSLRKSAMAREAEPPAASAMLSGRQLHAKKGPSSESASNALPPEGPASIEGSLIESGPIICAKAGIAIICRILCSDSDLRRSASAASSLASHRGRRDMISAMDLTDTKRQSAVSGAWKSPRGLTVFTIDGSSSTTGPSMSSSPSSSNRAANSGRKPSGSLPGSQGEDASNMTSRSCSTPLRLAASGCGNMSAIAGLRSSPL